MSRGVLLPSERQRRVRFRKSHQGLPVRWLAESLGREMALVPAARGRLPEAPPPHPPPLSPQYRGEGGRSPLMRQDGRGKTGQSATAELGLPQAPPVPDPGTPPPPAGHPM